MALNIENVRVAIANAMADPTFQRSARESKAADIRKIRDDIVMMRAKRYTWLQVSAALHSGGLEASPDLIRVTIRSISKTSTKTRSKSNEKTTDKPPPIAAAPPIVAALAPVESPPRHQAALGRRAGL